MTASRWEQGAEEEAEGVLRPEDAEGPPSRDGSELQLPTDTHRAQRVPDSAHKPFDVKLLQHRVGFQEMMHCHLGPALCYSGKKAGVGVGADTTFVVLPLKDLLWNMRKAFCGSEIRLFRTMWEFK